MTESQIKFLSLLVTAVVGIGGLVFSVWNLSTSRALEARRPFLEHQMELCFETSRLAARLAVAQPEARDEADLQRYYALFWGELAMVEDRAVEAAMVRFERSLSGGAAPAVAQQQALRIAYACRDLVLDGWGVDLAPLEGMRSPQPGE